MPPHDTAGPPAGAGDGSHWYGTFFNYDVRAADRAGDEILGWPLEPTPEEISPRSYASLVRAELRGDGVAPADPTLRIECPAPAPGRAGPEDLVQRRVQRPVPTGPLARRRRHRSAHGRGDGQDPAWRAGVGDRPRRRAGRGRSARAHRRRHGSAPDGRRTPGSERWPRCRGRGPAGLRDGEGRLVDHDGRDRLPARPGGAADADPGVSGGVAHVRAERGRWWGRTRLSESPGERGGQSDEPRPDVGLLALIALVAGGVVMLGVWASARRS